MLMLIVTILFILPPLIFIAPITGIFLCLVFQVFAFEADSTPLKSIKRSFSLVKSNFIPTTVIILLCFLLTYIYLPSLLIWSVEKTSFYSFSINMCENFINLLRPNDIISSLNVNEYLKNYLLDLLSPLSFARNIVEGTLSFIIISFTLPFRCCCFTDLYKFYDSEKIKEFSKSTDDIIKRAAK